MERNGKVPSGMAAAGIFIVALAGSFWPLVAILIHFTK